MPYPSIELSTLCVAETRNPLKRMPSPPACELARNAPATQDSAPPPITDIHDLPPGKAPSAEVSTLSIAWRYPRIYGFRIIRLSTRPVLMPTPFWFTYL